MSNQQQPAKPLDLVKDDLPTITKILALNNRPGTDVATIAAQEFMYLEAIAQSKPDILACTPASILLAVKGVLNKNLTLDPQAGLVYVKTRNVNTAPYGQPEKWTKVVEMMPSVNGIISINRQQGLLLDFTNPEPKKDAKGKVISVSMKVLLPSYGQPRWETREFDESDFKRWQIASHKENSRGYKANSGKPVPDINTLNYANPNYTSWQSGMDPEFARAKCIRHSLKKLGTNPRELPPSPVVNVKHQRVVDPEIEEGFDVGGEYQQYEEISSEINEPVQDDLPKSDDL